MQENVCEWTNITRTQLSKSIKQTRDGTTDANGSPFFCIPQNLASGCINFFSNDLLSKPRVNWSVQNVYSQLFIFKMHLYTIQFVMEKLNVQ